MYEASSLPLSSACCPPPPNVKYNLTTLLQLRAIVTIQRTFSYLLSYQVPFLSANLI